MLIFRATKEQLFKDLMSWAGCQNNSIDLNFYLQKSLEIFEKNSADKIWSNKDIKVKVPCPVLDRVKALANFHNFVTPTPLPLQFFSNICRQIFLTPPP